jgi:hypothetical protein
MNRQSPPQTARLLPPGSTHSWRSGHWAIAGIAAVEALLLQSAWEPLSSPAAALQWRPAAVVAIVLSTAWLISVTWCHVCLAQTSGLARRWPTLLQSLGDLGVAIAALAILRQGHQSPLASAGAWLLPPALLAVAVPSAALALASGLGVRRLALPSQQRSPSRATSLFVMLRAGSLVGLLALLVWLAMRSGSLPGPLR